MVHFLQIENQLSYTREVDIPEHFEIGDYVFYVQTVSEQGTALSHHPIIIDSPLPIVEEPRKISLLSSAGIGVAIVLAMIFLFILFVYYWSDIKPVKRRRKRR